jgi:hypothetical protein
VLATEAGLEADEVILATLRPVFERDDPVRPSVEAEFAALRSAFASIAAAHGGRLPTNSELTQSQAELLQGRVGGALEALSMVPPSLETEPLPVYAPIPQRDATIDP